MSFNFWKDYNFKDIVEILGGGTPKTTVPEYWNGNIPWLSVVDFNNDYRHVFKTEKSITELGLKNSSTKVLNIGDTIVSARGTVGALAQMIKPMAFNQSCYGLVANEKIITKNFLYYLLKHNIKILKANTHGSVFDTITTNTLENINIKIPPLKFQNFATNILVSLDDKIELNNKINKNLEAIAQTLYKRWFVDYEFPNEEGLPYQSSGGEMVESELGLIPKGWSVKTIDDITIFNKRGLSPVYSNDNYGAPVINQRCIRNHTIIEEAVQFHDLNLKKVNQELYQKSWDVLINSMGVGTLGRVSISSLDHNKIVHSCITILRPNKYLINESIFSYLMLSLEDKFMGMGEGSTGQTSLNNKLLGKMQIVLAPIDLQYPLSVLLGTLQKQIDNNLLIIQKISKIRDLLLPKLMSGEIEVPVGDDHGA
jgi:type I restriction enzyme, S subunit